VTIIVHQFRERCNQLSAQIECDINFIIGIRLIGFAFVT